MENALSQKIRSKLTKIDEEFSELLDKANSQKLQSSEKTRRFSNP